MKKLTLPFVGLLYAALAGCASNPQVELNYVANIPGELSGAMRLTPVQYSPADSGSVRANQVKRTDGEVIDYDDNVATFVARAIQQEASWVGIDVTEGAKLETYIQSLQVEPKSVSLNWQMDIRFILLAADGSSCYNKLHNLGTEVPKLVKPYRSIDKIVKLAITKLFSDTDFASCISER